MPMVKHTEHGDFHDDDGQTILIGMNKDFDCHDGGGTGFYFKIIVLMWSILYNRGIMSMQIFYIEHCQQ